MGRRAKKTPAGRWIGYARVSTEDQELRIQLDALQKAGCTNIWQEKRSASRGPRPELDKAITDLTEGDTLVVWKLDRLIRNARDLYRILDQIESKGATVKSLTEPHLDLHTPIGEFTMGLTALLARLEARTTAMRTSAGIKAIQERGMRYGAKPKLSPAKAAQLVTLHKSDRKKWTYAALARRFKIAPPTVVNYINRAKARRKKA